MAITDTENLLKQILNRLDHSAGKFDDFRSQIDKVQIELKQVGVICGKFETQIEELREQRHEADLRFSRMETEIARLNEKEKAREVKQEELEKEQRDSRRISVGTIIGFILSLLFFLANWLKGKV